MLNKDTQTLFAVGRHQYEPSCPLSSWTEVFKVKKIFYNINSPNFSTFFTCCATCDVNWIFHLQFRSWLLRWITLVLSSIDPFPVNWLHMLNKKYASHFQGGGQVPPLPMPAGAHVYLSTLWNFSMFAIYRPKLLTAWLSNNAAKLNSLPDAFCNSVLPVNIQFDAAYLVLSLCLLSVFLAVIRNIHTTLNWIRVIII